MNRQSTTKKLSVKRNQSSTPLKNPDSPPPLRIVANNSTRLNISEFINKPKSKEIQKSPLKKKEKEKKVYDMDDHEIIESFLKKNVTHEIVQEQQKMTDGEIEKFIQFNKNEKEDHQKLLINLQKLRSLTPMNEPRYTFILREHELVEKIISQLTFIISLLVDKQIVRVQIQNQATLMQKFVEQTQRMEIQFVNEFQNLKNYNKKLPSQREVELEKSMNELKRQLEYEQTLRKTVEENIEIKIMGLDCLYTEAKDAKQIFLNEIKLLRQERSKLKNLENYEDQREHDEMRTNKISEKKIQASLSNFAIQNKSFHRMQSQLNETKGLSSTSKQNY